MVSDETSTKLAAWSTKSGKPVAELQTKLAEIIAAETARNPTVTAAKIEQKARSILLTELKGEIQGFGSKAITFKGVVLGTTEAFDLGALQYQQAKDKYTANMPSVIAAYQQAKQLHAAGSEIPPAVLQQLATDEAGVPIDTKVSFGATGGKNPGFLKPLPEHNYLGNAFGVAAPEGGDIKPFRMQLTGDRAVMEIPIGTPVQFRANPKNLEQVKAGTETTYRLNDSTTTKFDPETSGNVPNGLTILGLPVLAAHKTELSGLKAFNDKVQALPNKNDRYNTPAIVQITARGVSGNTVGSKGSYRFVAEDESIAFDDEVSGITVWVPAQLAKYYTFGNGSIINLVCSTNEDDAWDSDAGAKDPNKKEITLTAMGFLVDPELAVPKDEQAQAASTETVSF
jgi:hypothetical protein